MFASVPNIRSLCQGFAVSRKRHELGNDLAVLHREHEHRPRRRAPALRRAPRVQNPQAADALDLRKMRVPVDDGVARAEARGEASLPPDTRPRVVDHPDPRSASLDDALLRQHQPKNLYLAGFYWLVFAAAAVTAILVAYYFLDKVVPQGGY